MGCCWVKAQNRDILLVSNIPIRDIYFFINIPIRDSIVDAV